MNTTDNHKHRKLVDEHSRRFLSGGTFRWKKSKSEVRAELQQRMSERPLGRSVRFPVLWMAAASIALLIGISSFIRFYRVTIDVPAGEHQVAVLPDGTRVELNAQSSLSYHPLWWPVERITKIEGEAYFEVQKGKKFVVHSRLGTTTVLGTTFNIFSREEAYRVTCVSGKVRVSNHYGKVVLLPGNRAEIIGAGEPRLMANIDVTSDISWRNNLFLFTRIPLREVFKEIERQYAATIEMPETNQLYTGNFNRTSQIEEVLSIVCPAAGLKFEKKSDNRYLVTKENQ